MYGEDVDEGALGVALGKHLAYPAASARDSDASQLLELLGHGAEPRLVEGVGGAGVGGGVGPACGRGASAGAAKSALPAASMWVRVKPALLKLTLAKPPMPLLGWNFRLSLGTAEA